MIKMIKMIKIQGLFKLLVHILGQWDVLQF